jgi:hypothetical protein
MCGGCCLSEHNRHHNNTLVVSAGRWAATAAYDAGTVGILELLPTPQAAAVEVSRLSPAAASLLEQQQQHQEEAVFLPAELQLSSVTTYPTELVGAAAHEAKFSPDGSLLVGVRLRF